MEELISKIVLKAYKISTKTKADVFVDYSGHINSFSISIYKNGWNEKQKPDYKKDLYMRLYKDIEIENELEDILKILMNLEKGE